jgi:hypothetical protein
MDETPSHFLLASAVQALFNEAFPWAAVTTARRQDRTHLSFVLAGVGSIMYVETSPSALSIVARHVDKEPPHNSVDAMLATLPNEGVLRNLRAAVAPSVMAMLLVYGDSGILRPDHVIPWLEKLAVQASALVNEGSSRFDRI